MNRILVLNVKMWIGKKNTKNYKLFFLINKNTKETWNDYKKLIRINQ